MRARTLPNNAPLRQAGERLLQTYTELAAQGQHLMGTLMAGQMPVQWAHYPSDDAIDHPSGFQWFYHTHDPADRVGAGEHGHIHLFVRRSRWGRRLQSRAEKAFNDLCGIGDSPASTASATRHLFAVSFDPKGLPINIFTVNRWVTGDLMLSSELSLKLLEDFQLDTGHIEVDTVLQALVTLCQVELHQLMQQRDATLRAHPSPDKLNDESLEVLSQLPIDLDAKLDAVL